MLVRGWAISGISGIGIRRAVSNTGRIAVIFAPATGAQLPAQEQGKPEQERGGHDQRRCQRLQIGDHAGASCFAARVSLLALLLMTARGVVRAPGPDAPGCREQTALAGTSRDRAI